MNKTTKAAIETTKREQRITIRNGQKQKVILTHDEAAWLITDLVAGVTDTQFRSCEIEM